MTTFRYRKERFGHGEYIWRPVADVFIEGASGAWIEFHPYIDSGADITMIPLSLGKLIGLSAQAQKTEEIGGIRGSVPVIHMRHKISVGGKILRVRIAWALLEEVPPLLGRSDVFDAFHVVFQQDTKTILFDDAFSS